MGPSVMSDNARTPLPPDFCKVSETKALRIHDLQSRINKRLIAKVAETLELAA